MSKCKCDYCQETRERRWEIRNGGVTEEELPWRKPGGRRSQNKKLWCRGKVGRVHEYVKIERSYCFIDMCKLCGKHGQYYWKPY